MVFAVIVFQILMIGIFALKENATVSALSIPPMFVTIIFYIFINMYWTRIAAFMELTNFKSTIDKGTPADEMFLKVILIHLSTCHLYLHVSSKLICTIYNMSSRVVSADTNSSRRREFVCPIQHGRELCKWLKKLIILYADWRKKFRNRRSLRRENQS